MNGLEMETGLQELLGEMRLLSAVQQCTLRLLYQQAREICREDMPGNFIQLTEGDAASALVLAWVIHHYTRQLRILFVPGNILKTHAAEFTSIGVASYVQSLDGLLQEEGDTRNWLGMVAMVHSGQPLNELSFNKLVALLHRQLSDDSVIVVDIPDNSIDQRQQMKIPPGTSFAAESSEHGVVLRRQGKFEPDPAIPASLIAEFMQDDPIVCGISTLMSSNERFQVYHVVRNLLPVRHRPVRFVEVGSFAGGTFYEICKALQRQGIAYQGVAVEPYVMPQFMEVMRTFEGNAIHLAMKSHEAAPVLARMFEPYGGPELVLIDGDHRYEAVCRDINDYYPLLAAGGIMMFHDYLPTCNKRNSAFITARKSGNEPSIGEACRELLEQKCGLKPLDLPLLYPGNPSQTLASQPIIPELFSTIRAYRKPVA